MNDVLGKVLSIVGHPSEEGRSTGVLPSETEDVEARRPFSFELSFAPDHLIPAWTIVCPGVTQRRSV